MCALGIFGGLVVVSGKRPFMEAREPSLWPFKRYNQRSREEEGQSIIFFGLWLREERHPKAKKSVWEANRQEEEEKQDSRRWTERNKEEKVDRYIGRDMLPRISALNNSNFKGKTPKEVTYHFFNSQQLLIVLAKHSEQRETNCSSNSSWRLACFQPLNCKSHLTESFVLPRVKRHPCFFT